jgi:hypothetical protein
MRNDEEESVHELFLKYYPSRVRQATKHFSQDVRFPANILTEYLFKFQV